MIKNLRVQEYDYEWGRISIPQCQFENDTKSNWVVSNNFKYYKFPLHFALTHFKIILLILHFTTIKLKPLIL